MQGGLVSISFRNLSVMEILELVGRSGLTGIEWGGDVHVPHGDVLLARQVGEETRAAGLTVAAYGSYYRAGSEDLPFEMVLESALALGAPVIRIWAGRQGSDTIDPSTRRLVTGDMQRVAGLAAAQGIKVACEYHGGTLTDTNASAQALLAEVAHENFYTYWQPPVGMSRVECVAGLQAVRARLAHVHAFTWLAGVGGVERKPLEEGALEWSEYLSLAGEAPRAAERYVLLEFARNDDPEQFLRDAAVLRCWLGL